MAFSRRTQTTQMVSFLLPTDLLVPPFGQNPEGARRHGTPYSLIPGEAEQSEGFSREIWKAGGFISVHFFCCLEFHHFKIPLNSLCPLPYQPVFRVLPIFVNFKATKKCLLLQMCEAFSRPSTPKCGVAGPSFPNNARFLYKAVVLVFGPVTLRSSYFSPCCCSVAKSCLILFDSVGCKTPGFPVFHYLPRFAQTHVHWVGGYYLTISASPTPLAFNLSQYQGLFQWVGASHQVAKVLEFHLQQQSFQWIFRIDFP